MSDNGVGIKEEDQTKLFKLYGFLPCTQDINAKGVGLGLYICKKIAKKLGGDMSVKSTHNEGSVFTYIVPLDSMPSAGGKAMLIRHLNPV